MCRVKSVIFFPFLFFVFWFLLFCFFIFFVPFSEQVWLFKMWLVSVFVCIFVHCCYLFAEIASDWIFEVRMIFISKTFFNEYNRYKLAVDNQIAPISPI